MSYEALLVLWLLSSPLFALIATALIHPEDSQ